MCGRYTLRRIQEVIEAMIALPELDDFYLTPRINIAPSQDVPLVFLHDDKRVINTASWGFVPFWTKGKPKAKPINARSETVATRGMFRTAFRSARCLLPADGFFEPKGPKTMKNRPQFYFHRPDDGIFAMAGLWSESAAGRTCALLTTTPNGVVGPIHNRMPVILDRAAYESWLNPSTPVDALLRLLRPAPDADLIVEAVTTRVEEEPSLFD